jgi:signal transduction histidine kinase
VGRIGAQLRSLAVDPQLKRLYLVRQGGSRELTDYLEERRVLLGLDFLQVADTSGAPVADAALATAAIARGALSVRPAGRATPDIRAALTLEPLEADSGLALGATASIQYERERVGIVHGGVVLGATVLARLRQTSGMDLILRDGSGRTEATTVATDIGPTIMRTVPLQLGVPPFPSLTGLVSTAAADQQIVALRWTSLVLALLGVILAVFLGMAWSSQIAQPVERLAAISQRLAAGDWEKPIAERSVRELETLVAALDRMRLDLLAYRGRLVTSERQAAWGQMARAVAHEIRNPLTPIAIAMSDLRRSYQQQRPEFPQILDQAVRTVGEEVESLKRLVQEFSEFGRMPAPQPRLTGSRSCSASSRHSMGTNARPAGWCSGRAIARSRSRWIPASSARR